MLDALDRRRASSVGLREVAEDDLGAVGRELTDRRGLEHDAHRAHCQLLELAEELLRVLALVQIVVVQQDVLIYAGELVLLLLVRIVMTYCECGLLL